MLSLVGMLLGIWFGYHFLGAVWRRSPFLTFKAPTIPKGLKRKVVIETGDVEMRIDPTNFSDVFHIFFSVFVVPYESLVVFVDKKLQEKQIQNGESPKEYVLSFQEKQHSTIHRKLNVSFESQSQIFRVFRKVSTFLTKQLLIVPDILAGVVAIFESLFYYQHNGIHGLIQTFPSHSLLHQTYLWHYFEELEHHAESTYGFVRVYGWKRFFLLIPAEIVFVVLVLLIESFVLMYVLLNAPTISSKLKLGMETLNDFMKLIALSFFSMVLLSFSLHSSDEIIFRDLGVLKSYYAAKLGQSFDSDELLLRVHPSKL